MVLALLLYGIQVHFASEEEISDQFKKGKITFSLYGQKLKGKFKLIRIRSREKKKISGF